MRNAAGEVYLLALATPVLNVHTAVQFAGDPIEIRSLHEIPDKTGTPRRFPIPVGFELRQGDRVVGSVDFIGYRVYLAQGLAPELRTKVALVSTVLLLGH